MSERPQHEALTDGDERRAAADRWRHLPERPAPEDVIEGEEVDPARDPDFGRDPDRDWLLRWGAG